MQQPISRNTLLFVLGATFAFGTASAGWAWKPAPTQMMEGMYQAPATGGMYPAPMMGGMYQAPGMGAMRSNPMMGRTYQAPRMGGMYPAPMMGGMYRPPTMGSMQGFINTNQQGMYARNDFKIIQETWTPPID